MYLHYTGDSVNTFTQATPSSLFVNRPSYSFTFAGKQVPAVFVLIQSALKGVGSPQLVFPVTLKVESSLVFVYPQYPLHTRGEVSDILYACRDPYRLMYVVPGAVVYSKYLLEKFL